MARLPSEWRCSPAAAEPCGLGYDERWLQDWLAPDPSRLGLGDVSIMDQEQNQTSGGRGH
ncbi:MAG: hypothetical protein H0W96_00735 [Solirubrobacterales bacterium]|nr:hypothetical protein [Solirubrobacterales bacterium]